MRDIDHINRSKVITIYMPDTSLYMFLSCSCMFKSIKVHGLAIYCSNLKPNTGQRENKIIFR